MKKKILYWTPRVLAIIAVLFMMMFSLDCIGSAIKESLICLVMHNIPAFIIIAILVIAWKWEAVGGIAFILAAIAGSIFFHVFNGNLGALIVMLPFLLTGVLFLWHYNLYLRKKLQKS